MSKNRCRNEALGRGIKISRHAVKRAIERGDIEPGNESHEYRRALSWLKKGLVKRGVRVTEWKSPSGEWNRIKGMTQLIAWDGWVGILRPIWGSKCLKMVTCYQAESR